MSALILAAGTGERFGKRKQFQLLFGRPLVHWATLQAESLPNLARTLVMVPENASSPLDFGEGWPKNKTPLNLMVGGRSRSETIQLGIGELAGNPAVVAADHFVAIIDANRPLMPLSVVRECAFAAIHSGASCPVLPVVDGIAIKSDGLVSHVPSKETTVAIQTPEVFNLQKYLSLPKSVRASTSTLGVVEAFVRSGHPVRPGPPHAVPGYRLRGHLAEVGAPGHVREAPPQSGD